MTYLSLLLILFEVHLLAVAPQSTHQHPEPASILLLPATSAGVNSSSSSQATIPAFPEQSNVAAAAAACPVDPPADLLPSISAGCAASAVGLPSRSRCCPAIHAWVLAAYSSTALAAHHLPVAASVDLPALPDDSESCIASAERELRRRGGPALPRVNATCDAAYCFCGVRLRRLACAGAFRADPQAGRWVPAGDAGRRLEEDCAHPGIGGCTRCLRTLNQLKAEHRQRASSGKATARLDSKDSATHGRECQLMGLTWLLSKNRTRFLPPATSVLEAFFLADGVDDPTSCSLSVDDSPLAVGTELIGAAHRGGGFAALPASPLLLQLVFLISIGFALCHA